MRLPQRTKNDGQQAALRGCLAFALIVGSCVSLKAEPPGAEETSLARFIPADGLSILLENQGLEADPAAWKATATYKMLTETSLGTMIEDMATQIPPNILPT